LERLKIVYLALLVVLGLLAVTVAYRAINQTISPSLELVSTQEVVSAGDEIVANFRIKNPSKETRRLTYALYLDDQRKYENTVEIKSEKSFVFGGHFRALEPGEVKVTAVVYEGDKEREIKNITYFVTVTSD
jgi:uncharacterized protein (DUF58 family)